MNDHHVHQSGKLYTEGTPLGEATSAMIMLHGRGASAQDILLLCEELNQPGMAYLAPQAVGNSWYPYRFLEPTERNEPHLSSALARVSELIAQAEAANIPAERIVLLGFSQGACLATDYAARNPRRYGAVIGLSGGLIGPINEARVYPNMEGNPLAGTPVFLGCSDVDMHIPLMRVEETADVLTTMGADVETRIYPNMGHTITMDEIEATRAILAKLNPTE